MRILTVSLIVVVLALFVLETQAEKKAKTKKLQIGIKKRVKDCKQKSAKGDSLHMHYTVSIEIFSGILFDFGFINYSRLMFWPMNERQRYFGLFLIRNHYVAVTKLLDNKILLLKKFP